MLSSLEYASLNLEHRQFTFLLCHALSRLCLNMEINPEHFGKVGKNRTNAYKFGGRTKLHHEG